MNSVTIPKNSWIMTPETIDHHKTIFILFSIYLFFLLGAPRCEAQANLSALDSNNIPIRIVDQLQKASSAENNKLLEAIELFPDAGCDKTLEEILVDWSGQSFVYTNFSSFYEKIKDQEGCYWTRLKFRNPDPIPHTRILYFPKGWQYLECYTPLSEQTYERSSIGTRRKQEVLYATIPPSDSFSIYVKYPGWTKAYIPFPFAREMSEEKYLTLRSRANYKFLLIGAMLFPILFFSAQFWVQKDRLSFFYLLFLLGSTLYLTSILDTIPFFELSPKLYASGETIRYVFIFSTFITLFGLVKYIHFFTDLSSRSRLLLKTGNALLLILFAVALMPVIFPSITDVPVYLQSIRILAILIFMYVMFLTIWAVFKRVQFSRILLLAFSPLIMSGVPYAVNFLLWDQYSWLSLESLIFIIGFLLTLLLFGVVLGVRNNAVKNEKLVLEQKAERLRELDSFKSRFYTNITHEFRTPLTVIRGMAGQIREDEKIRTLIQRNSDRLLNMVNQLLDLSKLESNTLTINWVQGNVISYLQYLTESCHSLAENKRISLAFFSHDEELIMDYDEIKLQQIIINLLSNAIKFTPEYGRVKVISSQVIEKGDPFLALEVTDTGKGISPDKLPHIFDRFYQADDSTTRKDEGSGIGLALVRELVHLLAGRIEVKSEVGKGSTFLVYLPCRQKALVEATPDLSSRPALIPESPVDAKELELLTETDDDLEKPQILIIEDNADVTQYIVSCLDSDYSLQTARNGKEGLEKALENIPDVIISDIMMPEMDGFEVCRSLKMDRRTSHIPIVLLTAKATQADKVTGLRHGADAYLTKPFDKEELLVRLHNLAGQSKRLRERLTNPGSTEEPASELETREADFLRELHQIVDSNMEDEQFDTQRLCRAIAMSRTQLHRKLKALTGQSTAAYIRSFRLQKARILLETTDEQIGQIALQVGYKDFSHFSRSFFKEFGVKPSDVRK